jgi:hypothetical protein
VKSGECDYAECPYAQCRLLACHGAENLCCLNAVEDLALRHFAERQFHGRRDTLANNVSKNDISTNDICLTTSSLQRITFFLDETVCQIRTIVFRANVFQAKGGLPKPPIFVQYFPD